MQLDISVRGKSGEERMETDSEQSLGLLGRSDNDNLYVAVRSSAKQIYVVNIAIIYK